MIKIKTNNNNFFEKINCPICKSKDYKIIKKSKIKLNSNNFEKKIDFFNSSSNQKLSQQLVECINCKLDYVNPRISSFLIHI